jgi:hypothetical protein
MHLIGWTLVSLPQERFTCEPTNTIRLSNVLRVYSFWADKKRKVQGGLGESLPALL